jgi:hypothetical protein
VKYFIACVVQNSDMPVIELGSIDSALGRDLSFAIAPLSSIGPSESCSGRTLPRCREQGLARSEAEVGFFAIGKIG